MGMKELIERKKKKKDFYQALNRIKKVEPTIAITQDIEQLRQITRNLYDFAINSLESAIRSIEER